jgi:hypothetical protein
MHYDGSISNRAKGRHPMLVEPGQRDEYGADLSEVADLLGEDEVGVKVRVAEIGDLVKLTVDSTTVTGSKHVYLDPVSADELADLLKMRAREARGVQ